MFSLLFSLLHPPPPTLLHSLRQDEKKMMWTYFFFSTGCVLRHFPSHSSVPSWQRTILAVRPSSAPRDEVSHLPPSTEEEDPWRSTTHGARHTSLADTNKNLEIFSREKENHFYYFIFFLVPKVEAPPLFFFFTEWLVMMFLERRNIPFAHSYTLEWPPVHPDWPSNFFPFFFFVSFFWNRDSHFWLVDEREIVVCLLHLVSSLFFYQKKMKSSHATFNTRQLDMTSHSTTNFDDWNAEREKRSFDSQASQSLRNLLKIFLDRTSTKCCDVHQQKVKKNSIRFSRAVLSTNVKIENSSTVCSLSSKKS